MSPLSEHDGNQADVVSRNDHSSVFKRIAKKVTAGAVAAATLLGGMALGVSSAEAANVPTTSYDRTLGNAAFEAARTENGLAQEMSYGAILHAWMWSFNTIKDNMKAIADAGYTSVQTSPISEIKGPMEGMRFYQNWWYVYQPTGTKIGNKVVGTEEELKAMTAEAHKYGIRVIVDGVINHFSSDWNAIDPEWQDSNLFHSALGNCGKSSPNSPNGDAIDYGNRWKVTQCHLLGLWDLNTQNQEVANRMAAYLKQAVADGVDGFRYDAAKHIELPNEFDQYSPYYDTILPNGAQYQYGEVLQGDSGLNAAAYPALFDQYSSNGGGNTGSKYGDVVRAAISTGRLNAQSLRNLQGDGVKDNQLVTWVESHDTYSNEEIDDNSGIDNHKIGKSTRLTAQQIRYGWAIIGSRAGGAPLFFNRPVGSGGNQKQFSEQTQLGQKGDDEWKHPEVVAVNKFRNAMEGAPENLQNCNGDNNCLMIERGIKDGSDTTDGVTVANTGGQKDLSGIAVILDDGTYKDQVHGNTITVSGGKITSGYASGNSVSVFWNGGGSVIGAESISANPVGGTFTGNGMDVTLRAQNATDLKWSTSDGKSGTFKSGDSIAVGVNAEVGDKITLTITGTGTKEGKALKQTYTYEKVERTAQSLSKYYSTNTTGQTIKKTISVDGNPSDWDESMKIAQGTANDDPRVYMENSMFEVPIDLYALYGTYDDENLYLMWEMTNVQDVVDPGDNYPLGRPLFSELNCPVWIVLDTGRSDNKVGKNMNLQTGGTIWASNISWEQSLNNLIGISYNGANGPWMYGGDETGLNSNAIYGPGANAATNTQKTGMKFKYGLGIKSSEVWGLDKGWGPYNGRVPGDMKNDNGNWVNFNTMGHNSAKEDATYELSIPLEELGITAADVEKTGVGVQIVATMGLSGMDALPYDLAANDNANLPDTTSQAINSYEKSDDDSYSAPLARIGAAGGVIETIPVDSVNIAGGDINIDLGTSRTAQVSASISPSNASVKKVTWSSSNEAVAKIDSKGNITASKAGTTTITATAGGKSASIKVTVTGELVTPTTTTVYYPSSVYGANSTYLHYSLDGDVEGAWTPLPGVKMEAACDGWLKYTINNPDQKQVEFVFNNGSGTWDNNGNANYKATGEVLKVESGKVTIDSAPCVVDVPVSSVSISGGNFSLKVNDTKTLSASVAPSNATNRAVSWSSSNTAVATVNASGTVTAKKAGTATITATAGGKSATVTVTVTENTVVELQSISIAGTGITGTNMKINKGSSTQLSVKANPSTATVGTPTWSSSDTSVVTVDGNGKLTAKNTGVAAVTVSASGKYATIVVTVSNNVVVNPVTGTFKDVPQGISFYNEIEWLAANGISKGYSDGRFGYYDNLNRQDMAIFLYRLAKLNGVGNAASYNPSTADYNKFSDVNKGSYAAKEILWLAKNGISQGSNGKFNGTSKLTRQDMAIFLYRFAKLAGSSSANSYTPSSSDYNKFKDVKQGTFAAKEILWLAKEGITKGNSDGTFGGSSKLTRSAMAAFMYRTHNHINK